ncbi:MAG TPA: TIGR00282 family metallophosphoesterase [Thermoanaerobaculia bacterium]|nr:TIGR00282 family metallophosphoesterase [Thermoanaerobaculia bacterium]
MILLFVGDVVGKPGRNALAALLPRLIDQHAVDYTVVNVENAAGGFGVTAETLSFFEALPIDVMTSGNHIWDKKEVGPLLQSSDRLLRPANYPEGNPGRGLHLGETPAGIPVATLNLEGQVFMKALVSPFTVADELLRGLPPELRVIFVDFHAEATSEKQAMAYHLDGRVSAVVGTHTHVPTADARVLGGGTALITDVGMTGPYDSIIGFRPDRVLQRFYLQTQVSFEVAKQDVRLAAALIDIDETTGHARSIRHLLEPWKG